MVWGSKAHQVQDDSERSVSAASDFEGIIPSIISSFKAFFSYTKPCINQRTNGKMTSMVDDLQWMSGVIREWMSESKRKLYTKLALLAIYQ